MPSMQTTTAQGSDAESIALAYLQSHGLKLVTRNYRCKAGEIDLIMRDQSTLVFVEVRLRKHAEFGGAASSITASKQRKLIHTAEHYLQQMGDTACRFDAILMRNADPASIEWIRNAFDA